MAANEDLDGKSLLDQTDIIEVTVSSLLDEKLTSAHDGCANSHRVMRKFVQVFMGFS
jgi:hypothetical protein